MAIDEVELFDELDLVAADAAGALDDRNQSSLFDRLSWWRMTERYIDDITPLVVRARCGEARAWLPLSRRRKALEPLGSWYTLGFRAVFADDDAAQRTQLLGEIAGALRRAAPILALWPMPQGDAVALADALGSAGWVVRMHQSSVNWRADVSEGWAPYWNARPSRLRNTVKRRGDALAVEIMASVDDEGWRLFRQVFSASWKPAEGSWAFLYQLAVTEAAAGRLRLSFARHNGEAVAAQLWLVDHGIATLHKLAYRADRRALSPGTVLLAKTIESLIDRDGVARIDFGTGDDPYKQEWADDPHALLTLEAADPRSPIGLARSVRWRLATLVGRDRLG